MLIKGDRENKGREKRRNERHGNRMKGSEIGNKDSDDYTRLGATGIWQEEAAVCLS